MLHHNSNLFEFLFVLLPYIYERIRTLSIENTIEYHRFDKNASLFHIPNLNQ